MIPSKSPHPAGAYRHAGRTLAVALAAPTCALILTAFGAPAAFALPAGEAAYAPSEGTTAAPDPHASMPGMDPNMPGMTHEQMPGMDPDMPGMTHEQMPGMDPDMPGMTHEQMPGMDPNMPGMTESGHVHGATVETSVRPQAAVVGGFVALNGGVLLTAGLMRRRAQRTRTTTSSRTARPAK